MRLEIPEQPSTIQCRASARLDTAPQWQFDSPVDFVFMPTGIHSIRAGFNGKPIDITVVVTRKTADILQASFDRVCEEGHGECFVDEEHEAARATIRFRAGETKFYYGTLRGNEGVIISGGRPTSYGVQLANGKTYTNFSPEFSTDAATHKAVEQNGVLVFPSGVRGSVENPAQITGLSDDLGAMTNRPAFHALPRLQASVPHDSRLDWYDARQEANRKFLDEFATREGRRKMVEFLESVKNKP